MPPPIRGGSPKAGEPPLEGPEPEERESENETR